MTFADRYRARLTAAPPISLQVVLPTPFAECGLDGPTLAAEVRAYHRDMNEAVVEFAVADTPEVANLVNPGGPPLSWAALASWGDHAVRLAGFDAPMPYGPIASCVAPALMPPEVKRDAAAHRSHVLLDHGGPSADPYERYLALMTVAGALARFGATAVLNEEGRTACPAFDLIPEDSEDAFATLRTLPLTYVMIGFARTSVGAPERPWVRTYGAHLFGLPDLAYQATGQGEWGTVFGWFAATLGYARETASTLAAGQALNLDGETELLLTSPPRPGGDLFESEGELLVVSRAGEPGT